MSNELTLIGDIGGTNARFAIVDGAERTLIGKKKCADYAEFSDAVAAYLSENNLKNITSAVFAVAGPLSGDRFKMTNNDWDFSIEETRNKLGFDKLELINDFTAVAYSIPALKEGEQYEQIFPNGQKPVMNGAIGIIGPGTGLGVAGLIWDGHKYIAVPGEGGHVTMPAKTQREFDIFQSIKKVAGRNHISAERVCSGKGLENLYLGIKALNEKTDKVDFLNAETISEKARNGSCSACVEALDLMLGFLGTTAGDLAVTLNAKGGIFIAGGIPGQVKDSFLKSRFREEFDFKGRTSPLVESIPTYLITHEHPGLLGLQQFVINQHR